MPDGPAPKEVVARAYTKEAIPQAPATEVDKMAGSMSSALEEQGFRASLEVARGERVEGRKVDEKIEQIGVVRDEDTGEKNRSPEEQQRYDEANGSSEAINKFLDKGFDTTERDGGLTHDERTLVFGKVLQEIKKHPSLAAEYSALNTSEQRAFILRHIRDPRFSEQMRTKLKEIVESPEIPDVVTDKEDLVHEQEIERDTKQAEIDEIDEQIAENTRKLNEFKRRRNPSGTSTKGEELDTLVGDRPSTQASLETKSRELEQMVQKMKDLDQERTASMRPNTNTRSTTEIDNERSTLTGEIDTKRGEIGAEQTKIDRIEQLTQEEGDLKEQKKSLGSEKREKDGDMQKIMLELRKRQRGHQDALSVRGSAEQDIVDALDGIWGDAAREIISEDLEKLIGQVDIQLENARKESNDKKTNAVLDKIQSELTKTITTKRWGRTKTRKVIDKKNTIELTNSIIENGPATAIDAIMLRTVNPDTGVPFTREEIEKLGQNSEARAAIEKQLITQALSKDIMIGDMTEDKVYQISNSRWGQGMIEQAMQSNADYKANLEKVFGAGALEKPGFAKRFAREVGNNKNLLWLLLLPLGFGAATAAGIAGSAAYDARQEGKMYA